MVVNGVMLQESRIRHVRGAQLRGGNQTLSGEGAGGAGRVWLKTNCRDAARAPVRRGGGALKKLHLADAGTT
jgi:hypothetical protein